MSPFTLVVEYHPVVAGLLSDALRADPNLAPLMQARDADHALALLANGEAPPLLVVDLERAPHRRDLILGLVRRDRRFARTAVVVIGDAAPEPARAPWLPGEVWLGRPFRREDLATAVRLALSRACELGEPLLDPIPVDVVCEQRATA